MPPPDAAPFPSLAALRAAHADLLRGVPPEGPDAAGAARVVDFLTRGAATGRLLDAPTDRAAAQGLLDYWAATLYTRPRSLAARAGGVASPAVPVVDTLLADFDTASVGQVAA